MQPYPLSDMWDRQPKFNKDELYRRRECDPNASASATTNIKTESHGQGMQPTPLPNHSRSVTGPSTIATPIKSEHIAGPSRQVTPSATKQSSSNIVTGLNTPRTTPVHQPVAQLNAGPPNAPRRGPPQAAARDLNDYTGRAHRVSVPPQAAEECGGGDDGGEDESFMMNSEDDAFYAGIDLGEDEALGGPIDFEEGLMANEMDAGSAEQRLPSPPPAHPAPQQDQRPLPGQASNPRAEQGRAQPPRRQPVSTNIPAATSTNSISAAIPSSGSAPTSSRPAPAPSTSELKSKPESSSQRLSMGGFRFPESMVNCLLQDSGMT